MAARSPRSAVASYLAELRGTARCVAPVEVIGEGHTPGSAYSVTFVPQGRFPPNIVPLRLGSGRTDFELSISLRYTVVNLAGIEDRTSYQIAESGYMFRVLDRGGRELFAYHWHPEGLSSVVHPHLHLSGVAPFVLPPGPGGRESTVLPVNKAHFPTGQVTPQEVIHLLIENLGVEPRTPNWRQILQAPS